MNVRTRDNQVHGEHLLTDVISFISRERGERALEGLFGGDAAADTKAADA